MNIQGKVAVTGRGLHRGMSVGNLSWEVCWVLYWVAVFETGPPQNTVREDKALPWITRFDLHILRFPIWKLWLCMYSPPFCTALCYVKPVLPFGKVKCTIAWGSRFQRARGYLRLVILIFQSKVVPSFPSQGTPCSLNHLLRHLPFISTFQV